MKIFDDGAGTIWDRRETASAVPLDAPRAAMLLAADTGAPGGLAPPA